MKHVWVAFAAMVFATTVLAAESKVVPQPFGFRAIDFSEELWNSVSDDCKLSGDVSDVVRYEDVVKAIVIRCNMHAAVGQMMDRFIQNKLTEADRFHTEEIPAWASRNMSSPLLTVLLETNGGRIGLLSVYSDFSVLEMSGRIGIILGQSMDKKTSESSN